jgi:hypothetical protein
VGSIVLLCLLLAPAVPAQPVAPRVRLVEDLRLDATTEDFPTVGRIYVGTKGQIVIPLRQDGHLRIYDAAGKRVATVGRRGSGPGEFMMFAGVGWFHDTLWVSDIQQRRTTFIGPDHEVLRTTIFPQAEQLAGHEGQVGYFDAIAMRPDGSVIGMGIHMPGGTGGRGAARQVFVLRPPGGGLREIIEPRYGDNEDWSMTVAGLTRGVPFSLQPQYAVARDGSRLAELHAPIPRRQDGTFSVRVFSPSGDTLVFRTFPFRGVPIPRRSADSALAAMMPAPGRPREGPADLPQRFQALARERMSQWYIPVETLTLGLDQTVWIGMRPTDEGRGYLILNDRGDPIGSVMVPTSTRVRQASATHIWVTETDDDGLSSVVRYRVLGLTCGAGGC